MQASRIIILIAALAGAGAVGWFAARQTMHHHVPPEPATTAAARSYQCPMHPWITSDQPDARCTICGMALVAATGGAASANGSAVDPGVVTLLPSQASVIGVRTSPVQRGSLARTLRVTGVIDDDETRHRILAARVPGRVEKLHVNFVGAEVEAGAPLATIFSPEMLTAQRTYLERELAGEGTFSASARAAARERLLELGLTEEEIRILEATRQPTAMLLVRAPLSGTVVARSVYEGQYVETNDRLFEIGDFSTMWFVFSAAEPDLAWLRPGLEVEVSVPSLPGRVLTAPITFIDPNLDETTRTARVRVELQNSERLVRHRQTAQAVVHFSAPDVLLVPRPAVLRHSGRPVVFVAQGDRSYAAREIALGRIGDTEAEVLAGLAESDHVVTQGALLLDSQAELAHAALGGGGHDHGTGELTRVRATTPPHDATALAALQRAALAGADASAALAADDLARYRTALPELRAAFDAYVAARPAETRGAFDGWRERLAEPEDLAGARRAFEPFSTSLADVVRAQQLHRNGGIRIFQCPMTPVLGAARWLSRTTDVRNPFFGSAMLECGEPVN